MLRRGKSRLATIIGFFFGGALLLCLIVQGIVLGCFLTFGSLPLSNDWFSQQINKKLPVGISISATAYSLHLDGGIEIENLEVAVEGVEQAVFHADLTHLEFETSWALSNPIVLRECVVSGGLLLLPAVYSPEGKPDTILEQIAMRLAPSENGFGISSFAALHDGIRLRGSVQLNTDRTSSKPILVKEKSDRFFKQAANMLKQKSRIAGFSNPTILFKVSSTDRNALDIASTISSPSYRDNNFQGENLKLDAVLSLRERTMINTSSIFLKAEQLEMPERKIRASNLSAKINREDWEALMKGEWPNMEIAAKTLGIENFQLESPRIKVRPQDYPRIRFEGSASGLKGAAQFSGTVDIKKRVAEIEAAGNIDLMPVLPKNILGKLPEINVTRAPYYNLEVNFNEGFQLGDVDLRARLDLLEVGGIKFDHIRFKSGYRKGQYSIESFYMHRGWQWLELACRLDQSTRDYALFLRGFVEPSDYNPILPKWWGALFREFNFERAEAGLGDFAIYGNTQRKAADFFFGHAFARNVSYKDVFVEEGQMFVRGRGPYAEVHRLEARTASAYAQGDIRFAFRVDGIKGPMSVRIDLDTQLPIKEARKLFDQEISSILADFETDALPQVSLKGTIFNQAYPEFDGLSYLNVSANCAAPIVFKGIPMDSLSFNLYGRAGMTSLREISFGYADGQAEANADIFADGSGTAQTRFELSIHQANQAEAIEPFSKLESDLEKDSEASNQASNRGLLDLRLHAQGTIQKPTLLNGYGSFRIQNDELYAIQIFGPLSRLLQNTLLNFTSFALNEMNANFALNQGEIAFQKLEISGPRTRIEAPGTMQLDDFSLAMRVSIYLFGNSGNPESRIRKIGELITSPIPNLLEFELTGTPVQQNWRSLYDPRKLIPQF